MAKKDLAVEMKSFTEDTQYLGKRGGQQRATQFEFEPKDAKAELTASFFLEKNGNSTA